MSISARAYQLVLLRKKVMNKDVTAFLFLKPSGFHFLAGQYLQLTILHDADEEGSNRFFTISSAPEEEHIMIVTRRSKSSFKKKLFSLKAGESVQMFGPIGSFVLD